MNPDTEPTDHAIGLLQRTRELLLDCRATAERLDAAPTGQEPPAAAAETALRSTPRRWDT